MKRHAFLLPILLAAMPSAADDVLVVRDAWIRAAPPGAVVLAGYATIENPGEANVRLVDASSSGFARVEFHEMRMADGMMKMRRLESVDVPAGKSVAFAPGSDHLMLHEPKRPIAKGDRIELDLVDEAGGRTRVTFDVR